MTKSKLFRLVRCCLPSASLALAGGCGETSLSESPDYNDETPVAIGQSSYDVKIDVEFYTPIGGASSMIDGKNADGDEEFTFRTPGQFSIKPYVTDRLSGDRLAAGCYSIEVEEIRYNAKQEDSDAWKNADWDAAQVIYGFGKETGSDCGIFITMPVEMEYASISNSYEISGKLNDRQGIARVAFNVKVYERDNSQESGSHHTYSKYLYIIRDNAGGSTAPDSLQSKD